MTAYITNLREYYVTRKEHHAFRQTAVSPYHLAASLAGVPDNFRAVRRLKWMLENEKPVVLPDEKIALLRTVPMVPEIHTETEFQTLAQNHYIHEKGKVCNVNPDYAAALSTGFTQKKEELHARIRYFQSVSDKKAVEFLQAIRETLDAIESFTEQYRQEALRVGNHTVAGVLSRVPRHAPETFYEALQYFRILHYCLWCGYNYHNTIGRFDQYMLPFYLKDKERGALDEDLALELLEEFFISFNKDSDLYPGMQQGDNGQSLMLGGTSVTGQDEYNELSELCLAACLELKLIDPKINLRVNQETPIARYERATHLTKQGLGFPQYCNDEIVIEGLKRWGYVEQDAHNYTVAACWEFIVPGKAMDIPNIGALSFTDTMIASMPLLHECETFQSFLDVVRQNIVEECAALCGSFKNLYMEPSPLLSVLMDGCVERGRDISTGGVYNNYGLHGTGLSTAADSLAAIRKYVFEEQTVSKAELTEALRHNYEGFDELHRLLRDEAPKMGNNDDSVDELASLLLTWFADALKGLRNDRGGIFRPGTGSAMYYVWHSRETEATPDGRRRGEGISCNYSPSLHSRCNGPFSIIQSFTKPDLVRVVNGGPLTIELHDSVFRNDESIQKVGLFVKTFMELGGHQIQLNAVNRDKLLDAKKNPEKYRNSLIVRVWGWSGYFVELDEVYQDHIIKRMELQL